LENKGMQKMITDQATEFLSQDILLNIDMLESIKRGNARIIQATEKGVLLFNTAGKTYMISTENEKTANYMIESVEQAEMFVAHQDFYISGIQNKFSFKETLSCYNAVYLRKEFLDEPENSISIKQLDVTYLHFIMKHYSRINDKEYLLERLNSGVMYGAFIENNLTGFIGMHAEGSAGMLEVLPEYRRQGVALSLETYITNQTLSKKFTPFGQIAAGNRASLELQKKLNFSVSAKTLCWLM
jgi:ribosomal protein S18 acetylase RimI-like enzyme